VQDTAHVDETVRKEEIKVEKRGDVNARASGTPSLLIVSANSAGERI
jgi:hypothetical protein